MIDLSLMKGIHVDAATRTARAQGGVLWSELNRETQLHGLAVTGGVIGSTGIAGFTLGGGMGWLLGKYGYTVDNLISAQIVTADGRVLTASERENADLFWGVRGGGGNFGIATSLEYRLHPVGPMITGGLIAYPYPAARDVLHFYRDACARCPDEFVPYAGLIHAPDAPDVRLAGILACHCGSPADGEAAARPIKSMNPADTERCVGWVRETFAAMRLFMGDVRYVNYLDSDEGDDPAAAAYGVNYPRLRSLKAKYDPDNFFHMNQNIRPKQ